MKKFTKLIIFLLLMAFIAIGPFGFHMSLAADEGYPCTGMTPDAICDVASKIIYAPLVITSWLLWLAGLLLESVLTFTVRNLATNINGISGINTSWGVIRDLANITFIFVLLYAAIRTILGVSDRSVKNVIVGVVIAALLINFSLFFTKIIIDASNLVALTFYNIIAPAPAAGAPATGLAYSFMEPLHLQTLFNVDSGQGGVAMLADLKYDYGKLAIVSIGGSIFLIVTSFVFLAVSIMFLIRFVNIIFLLILSPIGIAGTVMPGLKSSSSKWWGSLTDQAVFAPVYMIMTWVTLAIFRSPNFLLGATGGAVNPRLSGIFQDIASGTGTTGTFGLIMNFVIIIIFAIATLIISKQVSGQAGSVGSKVVGATLGLGAGVAGWGGRKFIGSAARTISDSERLKEKASEKGLGGMGARLALKASQSTAGASFDVRSNRTLGAVGGAVGFDINREFGTGRAGGKGGYNAIVKSKADEHERFAKSLAPSDIKISEANQKLKEAREAPNVTKKAVAAQEEKIQKLKDDWMKKPYTTTMDKTMQLAYEHDLKEMEDEKAKLSLAHKKAAAESEVEIKKAQGSVDTLKSAGGIRKESYAKTITSPSWIGLNQVPFLKKDGKPIISQANRLAAANLRKGQKPINEQLLEELQKTIAAGKADSVKETDTGGGSSGPIVGGATK